MSTGPGVSWPSASPSTNSRGVNQPNWPTTWSWMKAIIVRPPPIVNAPTFRKYTPRSSKLFGSGIRPEADEAGAAVCSHQTVESTAAATAHASAGAARLGFFGPDVGPDFE